MTGTPDRLYRSRNDRMIAGVCGGIAARFGLDPTLVRVVWALGTIFLAGLPGVVVYLILMLVMPEEA